MALLNAVSRAWRRTSLRTQLVTITSGLLLLTLVVTTFVSASLFRQELERNMDSELASNAQTLANYFYALRDDLPSDEEDSGPTYAELQAISRFYGWLLDDEGQPIPNLNLRTANSETADVPQIPRLTPQEASEIRYQAFEVPGTQPNSRGFRMMAVDLQHQEETVVIALPLDNLETSVERASFLVATIGLLATLGASVMAYSLVTRAFRPLLQVEKTAAAIAEGDFSQRVRTSSPPETEIGRLAAALNTMLEHIEEAFAEKAASEEKMRRFIQDASHELRTPLVTIRGFSELYRQGGLGENPEVVGTAMGRIESEATRLGQLVEDMLTLARLDEQRALENKPLDLNIIAHETVMDMTVNAPDREVKVIGLAGGSPAPAPVMGDEGRIRQIVTNLVTNALRYTPEGTPIELAVGTDSLVEGKQESVLEVRDHGEGIEPEDAQKIFERFYRADNSRQRETGGTGLGLAICAAIAAQHGGSVRHSETPGGGATMTLRLPLDQEAAAADEEHEVDLTEEELEQFRSAALGSRE
ncbi:sensor histidine kinase [Nesterenkonia alkaliphila]|uniref:histidine kinase n=1 Tax=Nesterenkonia alkaliphila TaxID=1463631 RepID=A0A7K1UFI7_9MICC|nr:HAMP domain-containing sensor histidine kinase [Nesterenkonia alkaliphila]MVT25228.1 HAMP domain-containing protein [Nesterenkonia alkaliphila]GFZ94995.1 two-component sensor histidine kinase [Nesterenkonia alkaliphila]